MAMDPVNKKALKKDFKDRKDQDIDNDGDVDSSDQYLHKRRKAVSKAIKNVKESMWGDKVPKSERPGYVKDPKTGKWVRETKMTKESLALAESDFSVGDEVECIKSGMEGKVIKVDQEEKGKYYTVKREDGKVIKYAPDELRAEDDDEEDDDKEDMNEDVRKMSHGRLKFHMNNKNVPHGSYSWDEMKAERDRRLKTGQGDAYRKAKSSMSEEVELDEISKKTLGSYVKKASDQVSDRGFEAGFKSGRGKSDEKVMKPYKKGEQRLRGISKAVDRLAKEEVELEEKAESQAQAIAARIALKHKRKGTKPEAGTASADMMKMSEKDLEDYTKAKKGAPEKVKKDDD